MTRPIPDDISALGRARAEARREHDFVEADRLRAEIEAAGWRVVDNGLRYRLAPAHAADVTEAGRVRYGSSASVPSLLDETPSGIASVVMRATNWPGDVARAITALRGHAPVNMQIVVVADAPSAGQAMALESVDQGDSVQASVDVVWTSARLGHAGALNAGIRRAAAATVVLLDPSVEPTGDVITPLVTALEPDSVAVVGSFGVRSSDLRTFETAPAGDVDAVEGYLMAFRRDDYRARGPLDEHFRFYRNLDLWWSLVLRDRGHESSSGRAVALDLPVTRHEDRGWSELPGDERQRLSKRNYYRILDRFGRRHDLLERPVETGVRAGRGSATQRG